MLAPKGALEIHEEAWNCFPYCKTVITNPDYMKDGFHITIITIHVDNDKGLQENVHNLPPDKLAKRDVVQVDIVNDPVSSSVLAPKGALEIHEEAWNCFPYCKTVITNPDYMKDGFHITIITIHVDNDKGLQENVHNLPPDKLAKRDVVQVDIVNDPVSSSDYKAEWDPSKVRSEKAQRGPLAKDWKETADPVMCCYKFVEVEFKWWGLQGTVESRVQK
jgi:hypothetical protein